MTIFVKFNSTLDLGVGCNDNGHTSRALEKPSNKKMKTKPLVLVGFVRRDIFLFFSLVSPDWINLRWNQSGHDLEFESSFSWRCLGRVSQSQM